MEISGEGVTMSPTVEKEEKKIPSIFKHCLCVQTFHLSVVSLYDTDCVFKGKGNGMQFYPCVISKSETL